MLQFFKYHGTGNDFVLFDNRNARIQQDQYDFFAALCHRRFGIGADGVILLEEHDEYDFEMYYVNSDGRPTSMCGNGGRCVVAFAQYLGIIEDHAHFLAIDGEHEAWIKDGQVKLKMGMPKGFQEFENGDHWIDTGSPHYVHFPDSEGTPDDYPVHAEGHRIRHQAPWAAAGTNVNFVWEQEKQLYVRTYERGVEAETWSCGTGVTAVAEVFARRKGQSQLSVDIATPGGALKVHVNADGAPLLEGPAQIVFSGEISPDHL